MNIYDSPVGQCYRMLRYIALQSLNLLPAERDSPLLSAIEFEENVPKTNILNICSASQWGVI